MSPIQALLVGIGVGASLVLFAQYMQVINQRLSSLKNIQEGIEEILSRPMPSHAHGDDVYDQEADREVEDLTPAEMEPIPIDPAHPPKNMVFYPSDVSRDPATYPVCNCHGEPIKVGAEMVHWPLPGDQGMLLFHAAWLKEQGMSPSSVR